MTYSTSDSVATLMTALQNMEGINGMSDLASAIGSPAQATDPMATMVQNIQNGKTNIQTAITGKGGTVTNTSGGSVPLFSDLANGVNALLPSPIDLSTILHTFKLPTALTTSYLGLAMSSDGRYVFAYSQNYQATGYLIDLVNQTQTAITPSGSTSGANITNALFANNKLYVFLNTSISTYVYSLTGALITSLSTSSYEVYGLTFVSSSNRIYVVCKGSSTGTTVYFGYIDVTKDTYTAISSTTSFTNSTVTFGQFYINESNLHIFVVYSNSTPYQYIYEYDQNWNIVNNVNCGVISQSSSFWDQANGVMYVYFYNDSRGYVYHKYNTNNALSYIGIELMPFSEALPANGNYPTNFSKLQGSKGLCGLGIMIYSNASVNGTTYTNNRFFAFIPVSDQEIQMLAAKQTFGNAAANMYGGLIVGNYVVIYDTGQNLTVYQIK